MGPRSLRRAASRPATALLLLAAACRPSSCAPLGSDATPTTPADMWRRCFDQPLPPRLAPAADAPTRLADFSAPPGSRAVRVNQIGFGDGPRKAKALCVSAERAQLDGHDLLDLRQTFLGDRRGLRYLHRLTEQELTIHAWDSPLGLGPFRLKAPYRLLVAPLEAGTRWSFDGPPFPGAAESVPHEMEIVAVGRAVDVPAGRFAHCLEVRQRMVHEQPHAVWCGEERWTAAEEVAFTTWLCPGVGFARSAGESRFTRADGAVCVQRSAGRLIAFAPGPR